MSEIVSEEDDNSSEGDICERTTDEWSLEENYKEGDTDVVANGITSALLEVNDGDKAKYMYKMMRLQFEREHEEKKRVHATEEAETRRAHELRLEDRRLQTDEAHDKRMKDCIFRILEQQKLETTS
ncbi:unnamed protein product [Phytophthora fragariaefolia]|uniref:Unnamed protein product n=1 Tax=Phytophthora fragariaefolia TaxID=1490495 RepID=A0A9W6TQU8_9STRA|nr:unnamed protein product [Phytophthora fragariaefolia]